MSHLLTIYWISLVVSLGISLIATTNKKNAERMMQAWFYGDYSYTPQQLNFMIYMVSVIPVVNTMLAAFFLATLFQSTKRP